MTLTDPFSQTTTFGFDMADRLTSKTFQNGVTTAIGYDGSDEVLSTVTSASGGGTLTSSAYGYDPAGNVVTRADSDGTSATFLYNGADQLTFENYLQNGSTTFLGYTYDHNGNRTTQNVNNSSLTSYTYNSSDELTSDSNGGTYSYDSDGNWTGLTGNGSTYAFVYDAANRLVHYTSPSASSGYSDHGMGLRVAENDSGSGQHDLINDGASPGSLLLVDHTITPAPENA